MIKGFEINNAIHTYYDKNLASEFDPTKNYEKGSYVIHNDLNNVNNTDEAVLYRCHTPVYAQSWTGENNWEKVTLGEEISQINATNNFYATSNLFEPGGLSELGEKIDTIQMANETYQTIRTKDFLSSKFWFRVLLDNFNFEASYWLYHYNIDGTFINKSEEYTSNKLFDESNLGNALIKVVIKSRNNNIGLSLDNNDYLSYIAFNKLDPTLTSLNLPPVSKIIGDIIYGDKNKNENTPQIMTELSSYAITNLNNILDMPNMSYFTTTGSILTSVLTGSGFNSSLLDNNKIYIIKKILLNINQQSTYRFTIESQDGIDKWIGNGVALPLQWNKISNEANSAGDYSEVGIFLYNQFALESGYYDNVLDTIIDSDTICHTKFLKVTPETYISSGDIEIYNDYIYITDYASYASDYPANIHQRIQYFDKNKNKITWYHEMVQDLTDSGLIDNDDGYSGNYGDWYAEIDTVQDYNIDSGMGLDEEDYPEQFIYRTRLRANRIPPETTYISINIPYNEISNLCISNRELLIPQYDYYYYKKNTTITDNFTIPKENPLYQYATKRTLMVIGGREIVANGSIMNDHVPYVAWSEYLKPYFEYISEKGFSTTVENNSFAIVSDAALQESYRGFKSEPFLRLSNYTIADYIKDDYLDSYFNSDDYIIYPNSWFGRIFFTTPTIDTGLWYDPIKDYPSMDTSALPTDVSDINNLYSKFKGTLSLLIHDILCANLCNKIYLCTSAPQKQNKEIVEQYDNAIREICEETPYITLIDLNKELKSLQQQCALPTEEYTSISLDGQKEIADVIWKTIIKTI